MDYSPESRKKVLDYVKKFKPLYGNLYVPAHHTSIYGFEIDDKGKLTGGDYLEDNETLVLIDAYVTQDTDESKKFSYNENFLYCFTFKFINLHRGKMTLIHKGAGIIVKNPNMPAEDFMKRINLIEIKP